jgi:hypothetical protein
MQQAGADHFVLAKFRRNVLKEGVAVGYRYGLGGLHQPIEIEGSHAICSYVRVALWAPSAQSATAPTPRTGKPGRDGTGTTKSCSRLFALGRFGAAGSSPRLTS